MYALFSSLIVALLLGNSAFPQHGTLFTKQTLGQHVCNAVRVEIGLSDTSAYQLTCAVTQLSEANAGTGASLVMYSPAYAQLGILVSLSDRLSGGILWCNNVYATGRTSLDEAVEQATTRIAIQVTEQLPMFTPATPMNVIVAQGR